MRILVMVGDIATGVALGWGVFTWQDRRRGQVLARLNRSWGDWELLPAALLCALTAILYGAIALRFGWDPVWLILTPTACMAAATRYGLLFLRGPTLRQMGVVYGDYRLLPWTRMTSWGWQDGNDRTATLVILKRTVPRIADLIPKRTFSVRVPLDKKPLVEGILGEKVKREDTG